MPKLNPEMYQGHDLQELLKCLVPRRGLCNIATITADALPYIHTAYYARRDLARLIFASNVDAKHSKNLEINPRCAITIYPSEQKWDDWKKGIQGFGIVVRLRGREFEACQRTYGNEYPEYKEWIREAGEAAEHLKPALYEVMLDQIRVLSEEEFGEENVVTVQMGIRDG